MTCELDLLCTAAVVDLVANLIYFSEEINNPLKKKSFAKTAYIGATKGN